MKYGDIVVVKAEVGRVRCLVRSGGINPDKPLEFFPASGMMDKGRYDFADRVFPKDNVWPGEPVPITDERPGKFNNEYNPRDLEPVGTDAPNWNTVNKADPYDVNRFHERKKAYAHRTVRLRRFPFADTVMGIVIGGTIKVEGDWDSASHYSGGFDMEPDYEPGHLNAHRYIHVIEVAIPSPPYSNRRLRKANIHMALPEDLRIFSRTPSDVVWGGC